MSSIQNENEDLLNNNVDNAIGDIVNPIGEATSSSKDSQKADTSGEIEMILGNQLMNSEELEFPYACDVCVKCFKRVANRDRHSYTHRWTTCFCEECETSFPEGSEIWSHVCEKEENKFMCRKCKLEFNEWPELVKHRKSHVHWCLFEGCGLSFASQEELDAHLELVSVHSKKALSSLGNEEKVACGKDMIEEKIESVEMIQGEIEEESGSRNENLESESLQNVQRPQVAKLHKSCSLIPVRNGQINVCSHDHGRANPVHFCTDTHKERFNRFAYKPGVPKPLPNLKK